MTKHAQETLAELMQIRGINRKSAVQFLRRQSKKASIAVVPAPESRAHVAMLELETLPPAPVVVVDMAKAEERVLADAVQRKARGTFDTAKAVALYQQGIKIPAIAVALGYPKGQGQNRTRAALRLAGVYKERQA